TPMNAAGYQIKYLKVDSGFALPFRDTALARNVDRPGLVVINPQDTLPYYYNGKIWKHVYTDSSGVIKLISSKVDSVTVSGNNLFYWVSGVGYGAQLNKLDSIHVSSDSIFTCIAGICTFVSAKVNTADSNTVYVTHWQLGAKVDTSHRDTTVAVPPLFVTNSSPTHHQIGVYMTTDSTFPGANDTTAASELAIRNYFINHLNFLTGITI